MRTSFPFSGVLEMSEATQMGEAEIGPRFVRDVSDPEVTAFRATAARPAGSAA